MNWGTLLQDALCGEPDKVPKGWKTARQIAEEIGKSLSHTDSLITRAVKLGAIEHRKFRILTGTGRVIPIPHYRQMK